MSGAQRLPATSRGKLRVEVLLLLLLRVGVTISSIQIPKNYVTDDLEQPPVITYHTKSLTAFQLDDFSLSCEATGNPKPSLRWTKDGMLFSDGHNLGHLTPNTSADLSFYQGTYQCYASNKLGTAVSPLIQVIVENMPVLPKERRMHINVEEGESLVLPCNPPHSSVPPNIYWMDNKLWHIKQDQRVTLGLDGNLYISNVVLSDTRNDYSCNAQYIEARTILPKDPISVSVQPSNELKANRRPQLHITKNLRRKYLALRGHSLTLECIPYGLPTPTVIWRRLDAPLSSRTNIERDGRWLHFHHISESDEGEYNCTAQNSEGHVTHTYTVSVEAAPYLLKPPQSALYTPGENVLLDCHAEGIPTPQITWKINGVPLQETLKEPRRRVNRTTLILNKVELGDTAVYQCVAENKHGTLLTNVYIHVVELPPQILTENNQQYNLIEGETGYLHCTSFGSPLPKISWYKYDEMSPVLFNPKMSQMTNGTLIITNISQDEAGPFTCSITGTNISITADVLVLNKTRVVVPPQNIHVQRGFTAVLHCGYEVDTRHPNPTIQWSTDDDEILSSAQDDKYTIFENGTLTVSDVDGADAGTYSCAIKTNQDADTATGSITVIDKPEAPYELQLSEKQNRSVTLAWRAGHDNNSPIQEFFIKIIESPRSEKSTKELRQVSGDIHHLEIPLLPFQTYHFQVAAKNKIGMSEYSSPSEPYSTPAAKPDMNPEDVQSNSTDPDSMIITWKELDRKHFNGPDFRYKVFWRDASSSDKEWHHAVVHHPPFIVNKTGTFIPFEIKVQGVNEEGEGPSPSVAIGHSGEDIPEEAPTDITVNKINSTTFSVSWTAVRPESIRGHLLGYKMYLERLGMTELAHHKGNRKRLLEIERELDKVMETHKREIVVQGNDTEQGILHDLEFFSTYELSVSAFNIKGEGPKSVPFQFNTPEGAPEPPLFLSAESPTENEITLNWIKPHKTNGILMGYVLRYSKLGKEHGLLEEKYIKDPQVTSYTVEDLDPGVHYAFYLSALTSAAEGKFTQLNSSTLLDGVPPREITINYDEKSLNLSWVPGERHRNIVFRVEYLENGSKANGQWMESEPVHSTQGFFRLQGLKPGTNYKLRIWFNNETYWKDDVRTNDAPVSADLQNNFASQSWFIGLISALVLLLLILLILCFVKKSKGGKYSVKDKEEGQMDSKEKPLKDEAFGEYSSDEEKHSMSQRSLCADIKRNSDDSLVEYGDSVDIQFNEDGSFIGQYSGRRDAPPYVHGDHESSGAASPINPNMPPPPSGSFPTSVTGILGGN